MTIIPAETPEVSHQYAVEGLLAAARVKKNKHWVKLNDAFRDRNRKSVRKLKYCIFRDDLIKIAYLHAAGVRHRYTADWEAEAKMFDPLNPMEHVVDWWRKPKKDSVRVVCDLSTQMKAAHLMIADVVRAQMYVPCFIYNVTPNGKSRRDIGRDPLISDLLKMLRNGFEFFQIYDVRNCFGCVNPACLTELPLPRRIYENTLKLSSLSFRHDTGRERKRRKISTTINNMIDQSAVSGPSGLMQGSPSSNVILAHLLQNIPQPDLHEGCILLFGDDLVLVTRSADVLRRVDQRLVQYFGLPDLGPLQLLRKTYNSPSSFEYLGYEMSHNVFSGEWSVGLSQRNMEKICRVRDLQSLKHWPKTGFTVDIAVARCILKRLNAHKSLTDKWATFRAIMEGGADTTEIAKRKMRADKKENCTSGLRYG